VGKKGRKRLQTNPGIVKTANLACQARVRTLTFDAVISCQNWPIKCLAFRGTEMNSKRTRVKLCFCILLPVDGVNVEISMNPNDQCRLYTFVLLICLKGRTARVKFWSFRSKPPESWIWSGKMTQAFKSSIFDPRCVFVQFQSPARQNGLPFSLWHRQLEALVKAPYKNKANPATDEVRMENRNQGLAWSESCNSKVNSK